MKKLISTFSFITCLILSVNSQNFTEVSSTEFNFSSGTLPVIQTQFDNVEKGNVEKALKIVFKDYKAKVSAMKDAEDEYLVSEFLLESNQKKSKGKFKITESNGNATLYSHFANEESVISEEKTPTEINNYKKIVKDIANKSVKLVYDELIEKQKNDIKSQRKKINQAKKNQESQHKNISKYTSSIKNSEQKIESLSQSLSTQEGLIIKNDERVKSKESEIASKSIKGMQKNISELEKDNKSLLKEINKHKEKIAQKKRSNSHPKLFNERK